MNPFTEKGIPITEQFRSWRQLYPHSYDKCEVDPYTKTRIILLNGAEFEANWFSHQLSRHTCDLDIRRELALTRAVEKQQQQKLSLLKPCNESALEHTISYEQLAVDLTAFLAARERDCYVKKALDFALLEDFDHLYRYSDLLEMEQGIAGERLVGRYTEIMPGRPTISHHRFPVDNVRRCVKRNDIQTVLATMTITAAEQQTMNYYMNISSLAQSEIARRLYEEIALVEEEHVTQYEDLMDADRTPLEMLLLHEYNECYLYWSCMLTETDDYIKSIFEEHFMMEISHLHKAAQLLEKYEHKEWQQVIPDGKFPSPIELHENIGYVRDILKNTVQYTSLLDEYVNVDCLPENANFFVYQNNVNPSVSIVPSHNVIDMRINRCGRDYRYEVAPSPVKELRNRMCDNTSVGREKGAAYSTDFICCE